MIFPSVGQLLCISSRLLPFPLPRFQATFQSDNPIDLNCNIDGLLVINSEMKITCLYYVPIMGELLLLHSSNIIERDKNIMYDVN